MFLGMASLSIFVSSRLASVISPTKFNRKRCNEKLHHAKLIDLTCASRGPHGVLFRGKNELLLLSQSSKVSLSLNCVIAPKVCSPIPHPLTIVKQAAFF